MRMISLIIFISSEVGHSITPTSSHTLSHMSQARHWCFTLNNWTPDEYAALLALDSDRVTYLVIGKEVGAQDTPHLQGYVQFNRQIRLSAARALISPRAHLEKRKGTPQEASDYCKKDGDFFERGELQFSGKRNDLVALVTDVRSGKRKRELSELHPNEVAKYPAFVDYVIGNAMVDTLLHPAIELRPWQEHLLTLLRGPRQHRKIYWVWSESSDIGKTTFSQWLHAEFKHDFRALPSLRWADIIDALKSEAPKIVYLNIPRCQVSDEKDYVFNVLEKLSDGWIQTGPKYQGGTVDLRQAHVFVTSNAPPPVDKLPSRLISCCVDPDVVNAFITH